MRKTKFIWQIYPPILALISLSMIAVLTYMAYSFRTSSMEATLASLKAKAVLLEHVFMPAAQINDPQKANILCKDIGIRLSSRITIIEMPSGKVLCDSDSDPPKMDNHANRDEISHAFNSGGDSHSERFSATVGKQLIYYGHPVKDAAGKTVYVVRIAIPRADFNAFLKLYDTKVLLVTTAVLFLAALAGYIISKKITAPITSIRKIVAGFAQGDLEKKIQAPDTQELADLADATNLMAYQLKSRIEAIDLQRSQLSAILTSMTEAVLALDSRLVITEVNPAATALLGLPLSGHIGMTIFEAVRNTGIHDLASKTLESDVTTEANITLTAPDNSEVHIQAHGTRIHGPENTGNGVLLVLTDVSRITRLENMRKEFVSNVSHEIKTPITSIRLSAETLRDELGQIAPDKIRFSDIIMRQAERLNNIISDILLLSTIEHDTERSLIETSDSPVSPVLKNAIEICESRADEKKMSIKLECDSTLKARINPEMLEHAVVNLIDNAIKYSPEATVIAISAEQTGKTVTISVKDQGYGIEEQHLDRLFERFYRVNKGRSREHGGTGLGLSIVKHIALAHNGSVSVTSTLGKGSIFSIHLPFKLLMC